MRRVWRQALFWSALVLAGASFAHAAHIPLKAWIAQQLLNDAWSSRLADGVPVRPWPWADTVPVARLRMDRLAVDQIVLAGASGRVLAFGPGHVSGTAKPGDDGNTVISAHRDTHFRWLRVVEIGDLLTLQAPDGDSLGYRVASMAVHHASDGYLLDPRLGSRLTLITCYPFDALNPGTQRRYVVTAFPQVM